MGLFLEIIIPFEGDELEPDARHQLEIEIDDALQARGVGEVTGGGTSADSANIDVDLADGADEATVVELLRGLLLEHGVPAETTIRRYQPTTITWDIGTGDRRS